MGRTLHANFVKKDELHRRLDAAGVPDTKKMGKDQACWRALDMGLITQEECDASLNRRTSTIPSYLHTHVHDPELRNKLEHYVRCYSRLFARGSYIANLAVIRSLPADLAQRIDQLVGLPDTAFCSPPPMLEDENEVKKCFLPERWAKEDRPAAVQQVLDAHGALLQPLLPDYQALMAATGWDNALNHMGTSYKGHVKVQVCTHLARRLKAYLNSEQHVVQPGSSRASYAWVLFNGLCHPTNALHQEDFATVAALREAWGAADPRQQLSSLFEEVTSVVWSLHLWLQAKLQGDERRGFSLLPVSTVNRKYAYLDHKIASSLLAGKIKKRMLQLTQAHQGSDLQKLLGLTCPLFNGNRAVARRKLRRKEWHKLRSQGQKAKKKWLRRGRSTLPRNAAIACLWTDGIGLRMCCSFPTDREEGCPEDAARAKEVLEQPYPEENTVFEGVDTGIVRMVSSCNSEGRTFMMTRKAYAYAQRKDRQERWEEQRRNGTPWGAALAAMSQAGGFKNHDLQTWVATLTAQNQHLDVILKELVHDLERAKKKMARFRWKKSWLDRQCKDWLEPAHKRKKHMVLGIGDATFPSTMGGSGKMAVPTEGLKAALRKAIRVLQLQRRVRGVAVAEDNTTKCCHRCGAVMSFLTTPGGGQCLRYRLCNACPGVAGTTGRRRHRDVNAAKNMLTLVKKQALGEPRPAHLTCDMGVLVDALEDNNAYHIVQELCAPVNLEATQMREERAAALIRGTLRALVQVHAAGIIHNDVKSGNLLLSHAHPAAAVKLGDFGACIHLANTRTAVEDRSLAVVDTLIGTPHFMAPETLRCTVCPQSGVWSVGVLAYELLSGGGLPFNDAGHNAAHPNLHLIWRAILMNDATFAGDAWEQVSSLAKDFVKACLAKAHADRPTATECLVHPWLSSPNSTSTELIAWPLLVPSRQAD